MPGLVYTINFENVLLVQGSWKFCVSCKAGSSQLPRLLSVRVFTNGVDGSAQPLEFRATRITADSGSASSAAPVKYNNALSTAVRATGRKDFTGTAPTEDGTDPHIFPSRVHPQGGLMQEAHFDGVYIKEATELALQIKVPSGGATDLLATGSIVLEE